MILGEIRYRYRRSRACHRQAWMCLLIVLYANAGAILLILAYNAGWVK